MYPFENQNTHSHVKRDDGESDKSNDISPFTSLWPITQCEDIAHDDQAEITIVEDDVHDVDTREIEGRIFESI